MSRYNRKFAYTHKQSRKAYARKKPETNFSSPVSPFFSYNSFSLAFHGSGNHTLDDLLAERKVENYDGRHGHQHSRHNLRIVGCKLSGVGTTELPTPGLSRSIPLPPHITNSPMKL